MKWKRSLLSWALVGVLALNMTGSTWAAPKEEIPQVEQDEIEQKTDSPEVSKTENIQNEAEQTTNSGELSWVEDTGVGTEEHGAVKEVPQETNTDYEESEQVRVFITMEGDSVIDAGYSTEEILQNIKAMEFSTDVEMQQDFVIEEIEKALGQKDVEVRYNFSMLTNAVSATVAYGDIEKIKEVNGVADVYLVPRYEVLDSSDTHTAAAGEMVGSYQTWDSGYTGAGQRIAIIDTGIDIDHPSFLESAFRYGLELTAESAGKNISDYHLMDAEAIDTVLDKLHASQRYEGLDAEELFRNDKIAYGFNYVDWNLDITHDNDTQGDHGTHVAGIAAANQYVPKNGENFEKQENGVVGIAKDAQLLVMKVFGSAGGAYTDDYMAAIEDAILLDADVINLSLGSEYAGESLADSEVEQYVNDIFEKLTETDTVVSISAGNAGAWSDNSTCKANRTDDVNMNTIAAPGSYYNAFTVASVENTDNDNGADGYTMSEFSSWGVPGDLLLKPEITAPGGNIYSTIDGGIYGSMSGTSMAAPSVAGMSALVMQYIKENNLEKKTGLSVRTLAQTLLMSTAVPLKEEDGEEYSPRKQGSGLANAAAATATPVYILMGEKEGDDGKVKAELGDDPLRTGVYSFDFTLCNMSERNQYYTLDSSILTEQVINDMWFHGSSCKLQPKVTVMSSGKEYLYDLNGDEKVDEQDAAVLLCYVNQSVTLDKVDYYQERFDFNQDGVINTVDVYWFLSELENETPFTDFQEICLEVADTTTVSVKIVLSDADREYLNTCFTHGMYIDGFIYLNGQVSLSIPFLAFYGGWSESSMFEPFDYLDYANGGTDDTNFTYSGIDAANYLTYRFAGDMEDYYYASNMYREEGDNEYIPERNSFSTESGDSFGNLSYSLIRNAGFVKISVTNAKTGDVYLESLQGSRAAAYYSVTEGMWENTITDYFPLDWAGTDEKGNPLPEGTQVNISVVALPAYYDEMTEDTADGVRWTIPVTIDNTAPKAVDMKETEHGKIEVTVKDNHYVAAVNVYERDKETLISSYAVNQQKAGTQETVTIEYPEQIFYIKVIDYAGNEVAYRVNKSGIADTEITSGVTLNQTTLRLAKGNESRLIAVVEPESILDDTVTWSSADETVATVDGNGVVKAVKAGTTRVTATTNARNADGERETAECEVVVEEISVSLNGIIWDENGEVHWANFTSDKLEEITWLSGSQDNSYMSATVIGDKILAATFTTDEEQMSEIYLVDPADEYGAEQIGSTYWCNDMAYSPNTGLVFAAYGTYVHWFSSSTVKSKGISNFSELTGGESLVGIAYAGYAAESQYGPMEWFYAVSQSGELYQLGYAIERGQFAYKDLGNTGLKTGDEWYFNSLYYDKTSGYLFWALYDGGNKVTLYALQENKEAADNTSLINTCVLGQTPDNVWPVAGLYRPFDVKGGSFRASENIIQNGQQAQLMKSSVPVVPEKKPTKNIKK